MNHTEQLITRAFELAELRAQGQNTDQQEAELMAEATIEEFVVLTLAVKQAKGIEPTDEEIAQVERKLSQLQADGIPIDVPVKELSDEHKQVVESLKS